MGSSVVSSRASFLRPFLRPFPSSVRHATSLGAERNMRSRKARESERRFRSASASSRSTAYSRRESSGMWSSVFSCVALRTSAGAKPVDGGGRERGGGGGGGGFQEPNHTHHTLNCASHSASHSGSVERGGLLGVCVRPQGAGVGNPLASSWPSTMSQPPNQGTLNRAVRAQHTCGVCLCPSFGAEAPFVSGVEPREVVAHRRRVQRVAHRRREGEEAGRRLDAHSMLPRVSRSAIAVSVAVEAGVDA